MVSFLALVGSSRELYGLLLREKFAAGLLKAACSSFVSMALESFALMVEQLLRKKCGSTRMLSSLIVRECLRL